LALQTFVAQGIGEFDDKLAQLAAQLATQQRQFDASNQAVFCLQGALP
jgi:hypothetical protein